MPPTRRTPQGPRLSRAGGSSYRPTVKRVGARQSPFLPMLERGPIDHTKFYFQHLSKDETQRFVDLYDVKKVNIGYPGHFYIWPFLMVPVPAG
jgi:hypothetical protein